MATTATDWNKFDPRLGDYGSCEAARVLEYACEFVGAAIEADDIIGWRDVDTERTAFKIAGGCTTVWTVTMDEDGAPDGRSKCVRVEVSRGK